MQRDLLRARGSLEVCYLSPTNRKSLFKLRTKSPVDMTPSGAQSVCPFLGVLYLSDPNLLICARFENFHMTWNLKQTPNESDLSEQCLSPSDVFQSRDGGVTGVARAEQMSVRTERGGFKR